MCKVRKLMVLVVMAFMMVVVLPSALAQPFTFGGLTGAGPDFTYGALEASQDHGLDAAGADFTFHGTTGAGPDFTFGALEAGQDHGLEGAGADFTFGALEASQDHGLDAAGADFTFGGLEGAGPCFTYGVVC